MTTPLEDAIAARDEWRKDLGKKVFDAWFKQAISSQQDEARYAAEKALEEVDMLRLFGRYSRLHRLTVKAALDAQQKSAEASALARAMLFAFLTPIEWI